MLTMDSNRFAPPASSQSNKQAKVGATKAAPRKKVKKESTPIPPSNEAAGKETNLIN